MIRQDYLIFLKNKEWYYWDSKEWKYKLTDKAPKEAIDSYKQFYKEGRKWQRQKELDLINKTN